MKIRLWLVLGFIFLLGNHEGICSQELTEDEIVDIEDEEELLDNDCFE